MIHRAALVTRPPATRIAARVAVMILATVISESNVPGQQDSGPPPSLPIELQNGGLEQATEADQFEAWYFRASPGRIIRRDEQVHFEGDQSVMIDTTQSAAGDKGQFANFVQTLDAQPYRGKRVRFRAAVKTDEIGQDGAAQLWFRVDRDTADGPRIGAFDNMGDRPIRDNAWKHYQIVQQVEADAKTIRVGILVIGKAKAWFDDASFEVTDDETPTTGGGQEVSTQRQAGPSAAVWAAAAESKPQPFFNHWLWLAAITVALLIMSQITRRNEFGESIDPGFLVKFALRFSLAYWLLYSFPQPFTSFLPGWIIEKPFALYHQVIDKTVRWTGAHILGIEYELVAPYGSGDTSFGYVQLFVGFVLALVIAMVWSLADRRQTDYRVTKDLLRSYLRYVLAITMLGYGLAKIGSVLHQFGHLSSHQMMRTYGDSSPMGLVWTFMAASPAYRTFSGLGEVVGGLLLVWRRTTTLGALVVVGVMLNVVMLNYCFDVPVKLYSTHLLGMALFLILPDAGRLSNILFWNRATQPAQQGPPYVLGPKTVWLQRLGKAILISFCVVIPLLVKVNLELSHAGKQAQVPEFFGAYEVDEVRLGDQLVSDPQQRLRRVSLEAASSADDRDDPQGLMSVLLGDGKRLVGRFTILEDGTRIRTQLAAHELIPPELTLQPRNDQRWQLSGETPQGHVVITLRRKDFLLRSRGFRWINEVPFNR